MAERDQDRPKLCTHGRCILFHTEAAIGLVQPSSSYTLPDVRPHRDAPGPPPRQSEFQKEEFLDRAPTCCSTRPLLAEAMVALVPTRLSTGVRSRVQNGRERGK